MLLGTSKVNSSQWEFQDTHVWYLDKHLRFVEYFTLIPGGGDVPAYLGCKEPLDESERGEWKSWPTAQHSEN